MPRTPTQLTHQRGSRLTSTKLGPLTGAGDLAASSTHRGRVTDTLHGLAKVAVQVVPGAEAASLTLVGADGVPSTLLSTSAFAHTMDVMQYRSNQGPCLEAAAATAWTAVLVSDLQEEKRWPAFTGDVPPGQARSVLSTSLFAGPTQEGMGVQALGSLNLYGREAGAFSGSDRDTALLLALYSALALAAAETIVDAGERMDELATAMTTRNVIGQAQGILMERHKVTAGEAFDRLRTASMNVNRKLRDVARELSETGDEITPTAAQRVANIESGRIRALGRYDILDTPPDGAFDGIAAIAARVFGVPMASVSIVDTDRVWFKASVGLHGAKQVTRDPGLCASVILADKPYLVSNARTDPRTAAHPLVTGDLGLQFYAACPITTADGHRLGTVAVMDTSPREGTAEQLAILEDLAAVVMDNLELRLSAMSALRDRD